MTLSIGFGFDRRLEIISGNLINLGAATSCKMNGTRCSTVTKRLFLSEEIVLADTDDVGFCTVVEEAVIDILLRDGRLDLDVVILSRGGCWA
jgi:hypothetical protein